MSQEPTPAMERRVTALAAAVSALSTPEALRLLAMLSALDLLRREVAGLPEPLSQRTSLSL